MPGGRITKRGALIWDFLATFIAARRLFLSIYRRYERRVLSGARERGVPRTELQLPPAALWKLFHLGRLERLRDDRLLPLRALAGDLFGEAGDEGLMDAYCGHIFHEISILSEEHRSVGRFVRLHDPRRYRALFDEVSGYYPLRLNRVMRFFRASMRRLDELLPRWSQERVVIRSIYLFGDRLAQAAYGQGREAFYARMYPEGLAVEGFVTAARSFVESGFFAHAGTAFQDALDAHEASDAEERERPAVQRARADAEAGLAEIARMAQARMAQASMAEGRSGATP
ncbi:MAG: hypothetical protein O2894_00215 [Planctomycetota bacterium]|nr:hypothetical protein [Planctomycetota bacterium]